MTQKRPPFLSPSHGPSLVGDCAKAVERLPKLRACRRDFILCRARLCTCSLLHYLRTASSSSRGETFRSAYIMANSTSAVSFDDIIQADRQRKKNEALANEIFGRTKQSKDAGKTSRNRIGSGPSLASRMGVGKRSSSTSSSGPQNRNPFNPPTRPSSTITQHARNNRINSALDSTQANIVPSQPRAKGPGLSIKGKAGPFVVEANNFAPGTTAADIESALADDTIDSEGKNGLTACRIISTHPAVIAEMTFLEEKLAQKIIARYDNQKADGRILQLHLKRAGREPTPPQHLRKTEPTYISDTVPVTSSKVVATDETDAAMEDIEMVAEQPTVYIDEREAANRDRRDRESRRAEPKLPEDQYASNDSRQLPQNDRNDDDRRDEHRERERERDRDREPDRERERDRNRDRGDRRYNDRGGFDRDRGSYRRDDYRGGRTRPTSHYGGGGGGRGMWNGPPPQGGGRMYSDDMMRGGGLRGGYRGYR